MRGTHFVAAELVCSSACTRQDVRGLEARVDLQKGPMLAVMFTLRADIDRLRIPFAVPPRRTDGLWRHTCFEAFLGVRGSPTYHEFNFSPSGEWAAYAFRAYRDGGPVADDKFAPSIFTQQAADQLTVQTTIPLACLQGIQRGDIMRIGLAAVIEAADGTLSYWAVTHPSEKPDFHHADSFALELALPK